MKYFVGDIVYTDEARYGSKKPVAKILSIYIDSDLVEFYDIEYLDGTSPYYDTITNSVTKRWFLGKVDTIKPCKDLRKFSLLK